MSADLAKGFLAGSVGACGAVLFTNPMEVTKVRFQLQGELTASSNTPKIYKHVGSAFSQIYKQEGLVGLQKGLPTAMVYQALLNGFRFGAFDFTRSCLNSGLSAVGIKSHAASSLGSGAIVGILGAFVASPFLLIKTRMQSFSGSSTLAVGQQHGYVQKGLIFAIKTIFEKKGLQGLWQGCTASMIRTGVGSSVQLPSYEVTKNYIVSKGWIDPEKQDIQLHFISSFVCSLVVCIAMSPLDLGMTRMYNQKSESRAYKSLADCLMQTVKVEGISALYKGFWAHYFRIGPHTVLAIVFLEQTRKILGVKY